jgi:CHAT domain-containing protein
VDGGEGDAGVAPQEGKEGRSKLELSILTSNTQRTPNQRSTIMGPDEEGKALATPEYWDSRYAQSNGEDPTHEWFRSYGALEPFFKESLFATKPAEKDPKVVHLGTGDSV